MGLPARQRATGQVCGDRRTSAVKGGVGLESVRLRRSPAIALGEPFRVAGRVVVRRASHQCDQQQALFGRQIGQRAAVPDVRRLFDAPGVAAEPPFRQQGIDHPVHLPMTADVDGGREVGEMPAHGTCGR